MWPSLKVSSSEYASIKHSFSIYRVIKQIDVVLFSHADIAHIGAYPYAFNQLGLKCPAYATFPVVSMGRIAVNDAVRSLKDDMKFDLLDTSDIQKAFAHITPLRYSQPTFLTDKCQGIVISAHSAGHTIGGAIWKIKNETDDIIYAVDYNHRKDRHLNGTSLHQNGAVHQELYRPTVLITDAYNSLVVHPPRKQRDSALTSTIVETLNESGSVLLPADSSTRVLELVYMLEQQWAAQRLPFPLILLSHNSRQTIQFARSMVEWMNDGVLRGNTGPFDLKHTKLVTRMQDLDQYPGPKVVLASVPSLSSGFSRSLFLDWCSNDANCIILTDRGAPGSLARELYDYWNARAEDGGVGLATGGNKAVVKPTIDMNDVMKFTVHRGVPLTGAKLLEYRSAKRQQEERAQAKAVARMEEEDDDVDLMSIDESSDDEDGRDAAPEAKLVATDDLLMGTGYDLYVKDMGGVSGDFSKQNQRSRMFPYVERRRRFDDYGEILNIDHFTRGQPQEPANGVNGPDASAMQVDGLVLDEPEEREDDVPKEYEVREVEMQLTCKLRYIDFEGINDGRSIKTIVPQVNPRKLVLIHGSPEATKDLADTCQAITAMTREIYTPSVGQTIQVSQGASAYSIKLTDALVSTLKFSKYEDYSLALVTGRVSFSNDSSVPFLDVVTAADTTQSKTDLISRGPLFIGDVRLTELKNLLTQQGIETEFQGDGVLVCDNQVAVRKNERGGQLLIEGNIGRTYRKVRQLIYSQHAILAA